MEPAKIALHQLADLKDQQERLISVTLIASTVLLWTPMLIPLIAIFTNATPIQRFDQFYAQPLTALILIATGLLITYWTLALANWEWGLVVISLGSCLAELSIFSFSSLNFIGSLLLLIANACCTIAVLITVDRIVSPPHIIKSANVPNLAPRFTVHVYTASLGVAAYCWLLGSAVGGIGGAVNRSIIQWLQSIGWADFTSRVLAVIFALLAGIIGAGFALLPFGLVSKNDRGISENSRNKNLSLLLSALISIGFLVWVYWLGGWAIFQ